MASGHVAILSIFARIVKKNKRATMNQNSKELMDKWSEKVEDLVDNNEFDSAISLLESVISNLQTQDSSSSSFSSKGLLLAAALGDLADLHASRGFSLKSDELRSRALTLRASENSEVKEDHEDGNDDDWEAIADRVALGESLLTSQQEREASSPSPVDPSPKVTPRRRGRGSFLYQKSCLYSDQADEGTTNCSSSISEDGVEVQNHRLDDEDDRGVDLRCGTGHILVLYDFSPTIRTIDLEKLFDDFRDRVFAIRWVNDTTALAVFRTPSIAHEAWNNIQFPCKVRQLDEEDDILTQIPIRDLDPPILRPKTSARTAQRLIAQGMGIKFLTDFGSKELRKQEDARRNRIIARQTMKDDAWGYN